MASRTNPRSVIARIAAYRMHALHDGRATSASARAAATHALNARLLNEIDPLYALSDAERAHRLALARKAHFARLGRRGGSASRRQGGAR